MRHFLKNSLLTVGACAAAITGTSEAQAFFWPFWGTTANSACNTGSRYTTGYGTANYGIAPGGCVGSNYTTGTSGYCPPGSWCGTTPTPSAPYYGGNYRTPAAPVYRPAPRPYDTRYSVPTYNAVPAYEWNTGRGNDPYLSRPTGNSPFYP